MTDRPAWLRVPGLGEYARSERERRFLVTGPVPVLLDRCRIEDRYLTGTRLRLRRVSAGEDVVFKLTQKVRVADHDPADVRITNTYLSREEYDVLAALSGSVLTKTRGRYREAGITWAVDVFDGAHAGLVLAETEVDDLAAELCLPAWLGAEVTHDDQYAGGTLARRT